MKKINNSLIGFAVLCFANVSSVYAEPVVNLGKDSPKELDIHQTISHLTGKEIVAEGTYRVSQKPLTSGEFVFCVGLIIRQEEQLFFAHINPTQIDSNEISEGIKSSIDPDKKAEVIIINANHRTPRKEDKKYITGDRKFLNWQAYKVAMEALEKSGIKDLPVISDPLVHGEMEWITVEPQVGAPITSVSYNYLKEFTKGILLTNKHINNSRLNNPRYK